ncbi:MAG: roadblock/LC7 domain-containing protein [Myxococcales bacterium]|nr:MAG: roadblock/LC7 domain-containing protein [Myxococcales bacterium]
MRNIQTVLQEEDYTRIIAACEELARESSAKVVFLVDKNGQLIASAGNAGAMDTTSLATLAAGNIAATGGLAKLLGEQEFSILFHEGEKDHLHLSIIAQRYILVVVFDNKSALGLVRLRVKQAGQQLESVFSEIAERGGKDANPLFAEITDEDIENLFKD